MRTHLSHTGVPPLLSGIDPAITEARSVIADTIGMLGIILNDDRKELRQRSRTIAIQLQAEKLRRADAVLRDLGVRSAR